MCYNHLYFKCLMCGRRLQQQPHCENLNAERRTLSEFGEASLASKALGLVDVSPSPTCRLTERFHHVLLMIVQNHMVLKS